MLKRIKKKWLGNINEKSLRNLFSVFKVKTIHGGSRSERIPMALGMIVDSFP